MLLKVPKLALFIAINAFMGCREGGYAPDGEFVDLYVDLKLASVASVQDPNKANEVRMAILAQHGMTPAEFHEHFIKLAAHPDTWRSFQERVVNRMADFQKEHQHGK